MLEELPRDEFRILLKYLDIDTICNLRLASTTLNRKVKDSDSKFQVWNIYLERYTDNEKLISTIRDSTNFYQDDSKMKIVLHAKIDESRFRPVDWYLSCLCTVPLTSFFFWAYSAFPLIKYELIRITKLSPYPDCYVYWPVQFWLLYIFAIFWLLYTLQISIRLHYHTLPHSWSEKKTK